MTDNAKDETATAGIYCVYDTKAESHMEPWFLPNANLALRAFGDAVNDPTHPFGKHPEDYHLVQVGVWKPISGTIVCPPAPISVATGTSVHKLVTKKETV